MGSLRVLSTAVAWQPWSRAVFARARAERKPVLLAISASWCASCGEMDRTSYADPEIVWRLDKHHHVGMIVASPSHERVAELLQSSLPRIREDFYASLPAAASATD